MSGRLSIAPSNGPSAHDTLIRLAILTAGCAALLCGHAKSAPPAAECRTKPAAPTHVADQRDGAVTLALSPAPIDEKIPADVLQFIQSRDSCDHFRSEIPAPEEIERMMEVVAEIQKFCAGTDKELASLKRKYGATPHALDSLLTYDPEIEK